jgi:hypothetical protein
MSANRSRNDGFIAYQSCLMLNCGSLFDLHDDNSFAEGEPSLRAFPQVARPVRASCMWCGCSGENDPVKRRAGCRSPKMKAEVVTSERQRLRVVALFHFRRQIYVKADSRSQSTKACRKQSCRSSGRGEEEDDGGAGAEKTLSGTTVQARLGQQKRLVFAKGGGETGFDGLVQDAGCGGESVGDCGGGRWC